MPKVLLVALVTMMVSCQAKQEPGSTALATEVDDGAALASFAPYERLFEITMAADVRGPERAEADIRTGLGTLFLRFAKIFGDDALRARLEDLARNSPLAQGKIALYFADDQHPHNILVGAPYTGLLLSELPGGPRAADDELGIKTIAIHEFSHLVFGKFNDGLAEPTANIFNPSPEPPRAADGQIMSPHEILTLAVLELATQGKGFTEFTPRAIMSYRPAAAAAICRDFRESASQEATIAGIKKRFSGEFTSYYNGVLGKRPVSSSTEGLRLAGEQLPSPNETRGPARDVLAAVGNTLMQFLIERHGLAGYFEFYYAPRSETLAALGYDGYDGLTEAVHDALRRRYAMLFTGEGASAFARYEESLLGEACYQPAHWNDESCERVRDDVGPVMREVAMARRGRARGALLSRVGKMPELALLPAVSEALASPNFPPLAVSIAAALGTDYDLTRYCADRHWAREE